MNNENEMKQFEVLNWASSFLKKHGREESAAALLLQYHVNMERSVFFREMQSMVPGEIINAFKNDIKAHALKGIPVQHLIGTAPFYGYEFLVNEHVLIPRFETEELVELVSEYIQSMPDHQDLVVVDIGTGSGVIAIMLKKMFPKLAVYATDISEEALFTAEKNAERLNVDIHFRQGDFLSPILNEGISPSIILSNPPYIDKREKEELNDTVKNYDPELALFAEEEGLYAYRRILSQAKKVQKDALKAIFFEIGAMQGKAVCNMVQKAFPEGSLNLVQDISGKDRMIKKIIADV